MDSDEEEAALAMAVLVRGGILLSPPRGTGGSGPATRDEAADLSRGDVELLGLLANGLPLEAVARRVNASERTVRRRVKGICDRLGFSSSIQAVVWAVRQGLV